jgi:hypothetical protein
MQGRRRVARSSSSLVLLIVVVVVVLVAAFFPSSAAASSSLRWVALGSACPLSLLASMNMLQALAGSVGGPMQIDDIMGKPAKEVTLEDVKCLSRAKAQRLFRACEAPSSLRRGEHSTELLRCGAAAPVSRFITHSWWGSGNRWIGKAFGPKGKGYNVFTRQPTTSTTTSTTTTTSGDPTILRARQFDFKLEPSAIDRKPSLVIRYGRHTRHILWRSMVDEVRCVNKGLLIGLGNVRLLGGSLNSAPFVMSASAKRPYQFGQQ